MVSSRINITVSFVLDSRIHLEMAAATGPQIINCIFVIQYITNLFVLSVHHELSKKILKTKDHKGCESDFK